MVEIIVLNEEEAEAYEGIDKLRALGWTVIAISPMDVQEKQNSLQGYADLEEWVKERISNL